MENQKYMIWQLIVVKKKIERFFNRLENHSMIFNVIDITYIRESNFLFHFQKQIAF